MRPGHEEGPEPQSKMGREGGHWGQWRKSPPTLQPDRRPRCRQDTVPVQGPPAPSASTPSLMGLAYNPTSTLGTPVPVPPAQVVSSPKGGASARPWQALLGTWISPGPHSATVTAGWAQQHGSPPWRPETGCRRAQTASPGSAPARGKGTQTWTCPPPGCSGRLQSSTGW